MAKLAGMTIAARAALFSDARPRSVSGSCGTHPRAFCAAGPSRSHTGRRALARRLDTDTDDRRLSTQIDKRPLI